MSDIKNALAQLRAARTTDEAQDSVPPVTVLPVTVPSAPDQSTQNTAPETVPAAQAPGSETGAGPLTRGEVKTLAGRVPLALHRELTRALLNAAEELRVNRLNVDEALEAAMRVVLRDPQAIQLWYDQLREVRRERRDS
jgi:hypothetical protein